MVGKYKIYKDSTSPVDGALSTSSSTVEYCRALRASSICGLNRNTATMGFKDSNLNKYIKNIKNSPPSLISNRHLLTTSALFALSGVPICAYNMQCR